MIQSEPPATGRGSKMQGAGWCRLSLLVLFERGPFPHPAGQHVLVAFLLRLSALVSGRMPPRRFAFAGEGDLCGNDLLGVGAVSKINKAQGVLPASGAMSLVP